MLFTRKTNDVCNVTGAVKAAKKAKTNTNSLKGYTPCP
jgi:hypothetical protein